MSKKKKQTIICISQKQILTLTQNKQKAFASFELATNCQRILFEINQTQNKMC